MENNEEVVYEVANEILAKVSNIDNSMTIFTNAFIVFLGVLVAIFVCYLMYKIIDRFINF